MVRGDPRLLEDATWFLVIVIWFLAVYLLITALAPLLLTAQERWGWLPLAVVAGAVVVVDVLRLGLDVTWIGNANYLLMWAAVHLLGLAWWDGMLVASSRRLWALAGGGALALAALTLGGPYPVSMVNVPAVQNAAPPTVALTALAAPSRGCSCSSAARCSGRCNDLVRGQPWWAAMPS